MLLQATRCLGSVKNSKRFYLDSHIPLFCFSCFLWFLADSTNGRAHATVLRRRLSVCDVMYCD